MNNYVIIKANSEEYDCFVLCLSCESPLSYINDIEQALVSNEVGEKILIDQLLVTGNEFNRFISCNFTQGKLDLRTVQIVNPPEYYRKETIEWLHNNLQYVEYSILTDSQRWKIKGKIPF